MASQHRDLRGALHWAERWLCVMPARRSSRLQHVGVTLMPTTLDVPTRASLLLAAGDRANQEARAAFAERYAGLIRGWCRRWGLQEADQDNVVQTIWCRLFEMLPTFQYDPGKRFRGFVKTMVHNAIMDLHRERQRRP